MRPGGGDDQPGSDEIAQHLGNERPGDPHRLGDLPAGPQVPGTMRAGQEDRRPDDVPAATGEPEFHPNSLLVNLT